MINLIEKTRQNLIAQHGENKSYFSNGYEVKKINSYLTAFEKFQPALFELANRVAFPLEEHSAELQKLFNFCTECEVDEMELMAKILQSKLKILKPTNQKVYYKKFAKLMTDLQDIIAKNNPLASVGVAFSNNFGISYRQTGEYDRQRNNLLISKYRNG